MIAFFFALGIINMIVIIGGKIKADTHTLPLRNTTIVPS